MNRSIEARNACSAGEVIRTIGGAVVFSQPPREALRKLSLARARVDTGLAEMALEPLLSHLERKPRDSAALFALVLIGSAHPDACEVARISVHEEAIRLCGLLESEGALEWAALLREVFEVDRTRELTGPSPRTPQGPGPEGRRPERVQPRRIRMSRGLWTVALGFLLLVGGIWREFDLRAQWSAVPSAQAGDLSSVEQRVRDLGFLIEGNGLWLGLPAVAAERLRLEGELKRLTRQEQVRLAGVERARTRRLADAEEARERGLLALEAGSLSEARKWFSYALERGEEDLQSAGEIAQDLVRLSEAHLARNEASGLGGDVDQ